MMRIWEYAFPKNMMAEMTTDFFTEAKYLNPLNRIDYISRICHTHKPDEYGKEDLAYERFYKT